VPGFTYRVFEPGEADALIGRVKRPELGLSEAFIRAALDKGDACNATLYNDEVVSFDWSAFTPTRVSEGVYVGFGQGFRYGYFAFTLPEFRGRHFARRFKAVKDLYSIARGCRHTIAYIDLDNISSVNSAIATGHRRIGFAGYWKRGPIFVAFRTRGAREHEFQFCRTLKKA